MTTADFPSLQDWHCFFDARAGPLCIGRPWCTLATGSRAGLDVYTHRDTIWMLYSEYIYIYMYVCSMYICDIYIYIYKYWYTVLYKYIHICVDRYLWEDYIILWYAILIFTLVREPKSRDWQKKCAIDGYTHIYIYTWEDHRTIWIIISAMFDYQRVSLLFACLMGKSQCSMSFDIIGISICMYSVAIRHSHGITHESRWFTYIYILFLWSLYIYIANC